MEFHSYSSFSLPTLQQGKYYILINLQKSWLILLSQAVLNFPRYSDKEEKLFNREIHHPPQIQYLNSSTNSSLLFSSSPLLLFIQFNPKCSHLNKVPQTTPCHSPIPHHNILLPSSPSQIHVNHPPISLITPNRNSPDPVSIRAGPTCTPPGHTHCHRPTVSASAASPTGGGGQLRRGGSDGSSGGRSAGSWPSHVLAGR